MIDKNRALAAYRSAFLDGYSLHAGRLVMPRIATASSDVTRIWIILLALLLLAAPTNNVCCEAVDAQSSMALCDDTDVSEIAMPTNARASNPSIVRAMLDDIVPHAPVLAAIFRPPRRLFD